VPYHTCFSTTGSLPVIAREVNGAVILGGVTITLPTGGAGGGAPIDETPIERCDGWCVTRLAGDDRFATAVAVSRAFWATGSTSAVLSTGFNYPDAIAGGPLAARRGVPVLLTRATSLPDTTRSELRRLGVSSVILTGGATAVSSAVVSDLIAMGIGVTRLFGADRYETSAAIAGQWASSAASTVVVASGTDFSAQLVGAHLAARQSAPLLLVRPDGAVPASVAEQIRRLAPSNIVVVGSVSSSGVDGVRSGDTVSVRRASTAEELSLVTQPGTFAPDTDFFVASSGDYPDALSGVAAAAKTGRPLLLTRPSCVSQSVLDFVNDEKLRDSLVLGGDKAVFAGISRHDPICALS
jgi:hypothetical protein